MPGPSAFLKALTFGVLGPAYPPPTSEMLWILHAGGQEGALVAFQGAWPSNVDYSSSPLLDALDHFCHQVDGDPEFERDFYAATTPEEMVTLAVHGCILIEADDFRALLRSGSTEFWLVRGEDATNPITHLQKVFRL